MMPMHEMAVDPRRGWRRAARSRLRMELAGLSFARANGRSPEEYARHLWGRGAKTWYGTGEVSPASYLLREAEAFRLLYPAVLFAIDELGDHLARLTFVEGCLGGWGRDQWGLARSLGLRKGHVCRYCRESFRQWSSQLGLVALPEPQMEDRCILTVRRP